MSEDLLLNRIEVLEQHIPALAGLESLDKRFEKTDSKLDKLTDELHRFHLNSASSFGAIETRLSKIETSIEAKASAAEVSDIRGSMRFLPNVWQLITLVFGILAGAFAIVRFGLPHS